MDKRINYIKINLVISFIIIFILCYVGLSLHNYITAFKFVNYGYFILLSYGFLIVHFFFILFSFFILLKEKQWKKLIFLLFIFILYIVILVILLFIITISSGYLGDMGK